MTNRRGYKRANVINGKCRAKKIAYATYATLYIRSTSTSTPGVTPPIPIPKNKRNMIKDKEIRMRHNIHFLKLGFMNSIAAFQFIFNNMESRYINSF